MKDINLLYRQSKEILFNSIPIYWPEMQDLSSDFMDTALLPEIITPAASCAAVGGELDNIKEISAAILAASISLRILDDLQDKDKPNALYLKIGMSRTLNYVDAFRTVAYKILSKKSSEDKKFIKIMETFSDCYLVVLKGQDRDLNRSNINWQDAWKTIEMKTGYIYATTAAIGAMAGGAYEDWVEACKKYGYHLGLAIQIFNDMDGIWYPKGLSDLEQGKITLPLLYGLHCEHPDKNELRNIIQENVVSEKWVQVKEILDHIDTKSYLIWAALKQRESAMQAISILPDNEGKQMLEAHFTGMFGDVEDILGTPLDNTRIQLHSDLKDPQIFSMDNVLTEINNQESIGLRLRRSIRRKIEIEKTIN